MDTITINISGRGNLLVNKEDYIRAKTGDLREFGYNDLTEEDVSAQLEAILAGEQLDIIGKFIEKDIVLPKGGKST